MPFDDLSERLNRAESRWRLVNTILPRSVARRFIDIDSVREHRRKRERVAEEFESAMRDLREMKTRLEADATALRDRSFEGSRIENVSVRLDQTRSRVASVRELDTRYLYRSELAELEDIERVVSRVDQWLTAYRTVGRHADDAERQFETLEDDLASYRGFQSYLSTPERRDILEAVSRIETTIDNGLDAARETPLADAYIDRLTELRRELAERSTFVETYNSRFIEREEAKHEALFTNIDEAGHDLSHEQREAVLHDDKYNLVVAGAGSGKTVTLTHRIAYLRERSNSVRPERILALSYTNNAAAVMSNRLEREFGIRGVETSTFHKLGMNIIEEERGVKPEVFSDQDRFNMIDEVIQTETNKRDSEFKRRYFQFLKHFYDDITSPAEFDEKESTVTEYLEESKQTLRQENVRSDSEKCIADFLFLNDVDYEYRSLQEWLEEAPGRGAYRANFYLPAYDIVISHHPVTASGDVPEWGAPSSRTELETAIRWERERFTETDEYRLIETYEFEARAGRLKRALRQRLIDAGVILDELSYEEFIESAFNYAEIEYKIKNLFNSFVRNARQLNLSPPELADRLADSPPKEFAFGRCALYLYRHYLEHLRANEYIDYPGMLYEAIEIASEHPDTYTTRYDQILVDEFQDISNAEVELLHCLVTPDNDTTLFCVGDDWQSIYSFSGSDVTFFIDFEEYFGTPHRTELTANYRCPRTVVEASNDLIRNNERQLEKTVEAVGSADTDIQLHSLTSAPFWESYKNELCAYVAALLERYLERGATPGEVMVLCRTNLFYDQLEVACAGRGIDATQSPEDKSNPSEYVRLYSVHKSKGDEADHVIIMHAVEDTYGFPSQVENDDLIEPVRIQPEENIAEERRLFYVAMTRSSETLDIVTSTNYRSRFIDEIDHHLTPATLGALSTDNERVTLRRVKVEQSFGSANKQTQAGLVTDGTTTKKFIIWEDSGHDALTEGNTYTLTDARVSYNDYNDSYELHLDRGTEIELLDE